MSTLVDWQAVLAGDVRANPSYQLRPIASLPAGLRRTLRRWGIDTSTAVAVLIAPHDPALTPKVVDAAAAELVADLVRPGRPPAVPSNRLAGLVLDGVLEVEGPAGFVSGALLCDALAGDARVSPTGSDRLGQLARAAVAYGERLRLTSVEGLTARLYCYHRIPGSRRWIQSYPGPGSVLDLLSGPALDRHWDVTSSGRRSRWLSWSRRHDDASAAAGSFPYKLYVSPRIDDVPSVLARLADVLTTTAASRFKVGADATGLLRPDKIVVYLRDAEETATVAAALAMAYAGVSAHGVPFSACLAPGGLTSWGGDPLPDAAPIGRRAESWRLSVCRRLAEGLIAAQRARLTRIRPADFALERLAVDDVDVRSFAPAGLPIPRIAA